MTGEILIDLRYHFEKKWTVIAFMEFFWWDEGNCWAIKQTFRIAQFELNTSMDISSFLIKPVWKNMVSQMYVSDLDFISKKQCSHSCAFPTFHSIIGNSLILAINGQYWQYISTIEKSFVSLNRYLSNWNESCGLLTQNFQWWLF